KEKDVGAILMGKGRNGKLLAILQLRAGRNKKKGEPQTYPGACEISIHAKLKKGEDFFEGLKREVEEKFGKEMACIIQKMHDENQLIELVNDKQNITYGAVVGERIIRTLLIKPQSPEFAGFRLIRHDEVDKIVNVETLSERIGPIEPETVAMFRNEKTVVERAFQKFG
ncbi:MAG TPA: hypothetical protein VK675_03165, partial [Candidatus Paceibacterota bacterium]|nr:hypothetical protein [Candidatus Paceibacterota bacterium]